MTHDNFATDNKLGLPLSAPSTQTILPVVTDNGNIQGFFTISETTFTGAETTFALAEGSVAIKSVTLPEKVSDGRGYGVRQYMAAVYATPRLREWLGYSAFVNTNDTGYGVRHVMPTQGWFTYYNRGVLVTNLLVGMDATVTVPESNVPPDASNGTIRWVASMSAASSQMKCGFFDFPWVDLFKVKSDRTAVRIEIVSNPAGGEFKSTLVPNPTITPLGGVEFNTVRIIRLKDVAAGAYVFTYKVVDDKNQSTTCTLTLTVV